MLAEVVPYVAGTKRIVISKDGKELASRTVSANAPKIKLIYPNGGETLKGTAATVRWSASDADGDKLTFTLLYSADAGKTWQVLAVRIKESQFTVNPQELSGSVHASFRVIATDGVNTGMDDSDGTFLVPPKTPHAQIISPANKSSFSTTQTIVFVGEAFDLEDGQLDGKSMQWSSDKQGVIGFGRSITATSMTPGTHMITMAAKDKSGAVGKASIQIEVISAPPIADTGPDETVIAGSTVQLNGYNSHGFGKLVYRWEILAKPKDSKARLLDGGTPQIKFIADLPGEYVVQLLIKDATGATAVDRTIIKAVQTDDVPENMQTHTFSNVMIKSGPCAGYRLDWCLHWSKDCGEPAATTWCRMAGYERATQWNEAEDIGANSPTCVIGDGRVCNQDVCDGFSYITCSHE